MDVNINNFVHLLWIDWYTDVNLFDGIQIELNYTFALCTFRFNCFVSSVSVPVFC